MIFKQHFLKSFYSGGHVAATFDRICSGLRPPHSVQHDLDLLAQVATLGKPGAKVTICQAVADQVNYLCNNYTVNRTAAI